MPTADAFLGEDAGSFLDSTTSGGSADAFLDTEDKGLYLRTMDSLANASGKVTEAIKAGAEGAASTVWPALLKRAVDFNKLGATAAGMAFPQYQPAIDAARGPLINQPEADIKRSQEDLAAQKDGQPFWKRLSTDIGAGFGGLPAAGLDLFAGRGLGTAAGLSEAMTAKQALPLGMAFFGAGEGGATGAVKGYLEGAAMHGAGEIGQGLSTVPRVAAQMGAQGAVAAGINSADAFLDGRVPTTEETISAGATGAAMGVPFALTPRPMGVERPRDSGRLNATAFPGSSEGNRLSPEQFGAFLTDTPAGQALSSTIADLRASGQGALADKLQVTSANAGGHATGSRHYRGQAVDINSKVLTPDEQAAVAEVAKRYGLVRDVDGEPWHFSYRGQSGGDADYLARVRQAESGGDDNARAATSSASGPYQFTDGTWRAMVQQYGKDYGLTLDGKADPSQQVAAAILLTRDNREALRASLGREPSDGDLYMAHVFGRTGAERILEGMAENPGDLAINHVAPAAVRANQSIFFSKDGRTRTLQEVYDLITRKVAPKEGEVVPAATPAAPQSDALRQGMEARAQGVTEANDGRLRLEDSPAMPAQDVRFHLNEKPAEAFRGITPEEVAHGIQGYTETAPGAAPVEIVKTQAELPQHIQEEYRRAGLRGGVEGVYDIVNRKVWLVADNLESKSRAGEIWLHENVAHHGLRAVFGSDGGFDTFLRRNAKEFGYGDHIAMEEHIARLAEKMDVGEALTPKETSLWGRFVDYVRSWLVRHGWATPKDADLHNLLRESLTRMTREAGGQEAEAGARFAVRSPQSDYQRDRMAFDGRGREPIGERIKEAGRELYRRGVHREQPLVDLARRADSVAAQSIENQVRRMRGLGGVAEEMLTGKGALRYGIDGQETVPVQGTQSLKDILAPLKTEEIYRDYETLRAAERERALAIHRPDVRGNDRGRAEFEINRLERKYGPADTAMLRGVSAAHRQFERDAILTPLHEAGWISKEAYDAILKAPESEYYASFAREMEGVESQAVGSRDVVRKIKGSERKLLPSTEATIANVVRAVKLVETLKLHQQIVSLRDLTPDLAQEIKLYKKGGLAPRDALVTVENGRKTYWKVPPDVAKALDAFNPREANVIVKALSIPAKMLRAGATLGLEFIARNPVRDNISAFIYSKYGYNPITDFARGVFHTIKGEIGSGSDWYSEWRAAGGAEAFMTSLDRDAVRLTTKDLVAYRTGMDSLGRYVKSPAEALKLILSFPKTALGGLQAISEFGEKGTRVGAFIKAREKGATPLEAMGESRDITLDFSRMGADTRVLNQLAAFWNANIQGTDKMARALKERPGMTLLKAGLGLTLPSITLALMNQGQQWYEELPAWQKDYFWCFKVGDTILRIPKPFELGILFGSLPERIVDFAYRKDPQGFKDVGRAAFDALTPGWMPTAALPLVETVANYSFFRGKPLENQSVQSLPPGMRANSGTSEAAKRLGQATDISPIMLENWFRSWTGSMGKMALDVSGLAMRDPNIPPVAGTAADVPLVKGFVAREPIGSGSESVDRFYDTLGETTQAQQGRKALLESGDQAGAARYDRNAFFAPAARALSSKMSDMRAEIAGIQEAPGISSEEKRTRIDAINQQMTAAAREFGDAYRSGAMTPEIQYLGERARVNEAMDQYKELVKAGRVDEARGLVRDAGLDTKAGLVKWADAVMAKAAKIRKAVDDAGGKLSTSQRTAYLAEADRLTQTALAEFQKRTGGPRVWQ